MQNDTLFIAAAGSGKTRHLVNVASEHPNDKVLITTYTEANEAELRKSIIRKNTCIPANVTIQTWFSLLLQHGVRPYQGALKDFLFENEIKGMLLVNKRSGINYTTERGPVYFAEDKEFKKHYFAPSMKIYSDKVSKFVFRANEATSGEVINRLSSLYSLILVDEVQDLAGYDLELLKLLFESNTTIVLVGDPRQVTYLTHHAQKHPKYKDGKIRDFVLNELSDRIRPKIDEKTLNVSHRNNKPICEYSAKVFSDFPAILPCTCVTCRQTDSEHTGIFLVRRRDVDDYLHKYNPVQLRWNKTRIVNDNFSVKTFGGSKGSTLNRVLIYPTGPMEQWVLNNSSELTYEARAKLYVGITRAKLSVGIVMDFESAENFDGIEKYSPEEEAKK